VNTSAVPEPQAKRSRWIALAGKGRIWVRQHPRWTALLTGTLLLALLDQLLPPPIPDISADGATVVLAADGTPLRAFANDRGVWRYPVRIDEVSPRYIEALLGYEDRWFRWHPGVNPLALLRASGQALWHGRAVSGASTLSMQVARLIEPIPHTLPGKLWQSLRALQLEARLSKDQILTLYLNLAPFGGGIEGVQAASYAYLGKPAGSLSYAEAALLAVLPQSPTRLRPDRQPARARIARDKVLSRLAQFGDWPASVVAEASDENVIARSLRVPMRAALLAERLHREHPELRRIATPIDAGLQRSVEERLALWIERLPPRTSAAVLIVDNASLEVRAYLGAAHFGDAARLGHIDMVAAERSPGSTLKPFLYGMALEQGLIHSESLLVDAPQDFQGYRPANFGDTFNGPVSAAEALRLSLNVPAVDLLERVTPARFAARLRHAGVELSLPKAARPNLAIILGGTATRLEQLVGAYTALARAGLAGKVRLHDGDPLVERRLLSPGAAYIVRHMLEQHGQPGDIEGVFAEGQRGAIAWKTGTSYGYRDAWAIGVGDQATVGVWVGRPDGTPSPGQYGANTALPLLFALAERLPRGTTTATRSPPASVSQATICWPLGEAFDPQEPQLCQRRREALLLDSNLPPTLMTRDSPASSSLARSWWRDPDSGLRVLPGCAGARAVLTLSAAWPVLASPWLSARERAASRLPALAPACAGQSDPQVIARLRIDGLLPNAILRAAPGGSLPAARLRALGAEGRVHWLLDGRWIADSEGESSVDQPFDRSGRHSITAIDQSGAFDHLSILVQLPDR